MNQQNKSQILCSTGIPRVWISLKMKFLERHQSGLKVRCHHHFTHWMTLSLHQAWEAGSVCGDVGEKERKGRVPFLRRHHDSASTYPQAVSTFLTVRDHCFRLSTNPWTSAATAFSFWRHYYFQVIMLRFSSMWTIVGLLKAFTPISGNGSFSLSGWCQSHFKYYGEVTGFSVMTISGFF